MSDVTINCGHCGFQYQAKYKEALSETSALCPKCNRRLDMWIADETTQPTRTIVSGVEEKIEALEKRLNTWIADKTTQPARTIVSGVERKIKSLEMCILQLSERVKKLEALEKRLNMWIGDETTKHARTIVSDIERKIKSLEMCILQLSERVKKLETKLFPEKRECSYCEREATAFEVCSSWSPDVAQTWSPGMAHTYKCPDHMFGPHKEKVHILCEGCGYQKMKTEPPETSICPTCQRAGLKIYLEDKEVFLERSIS